MIIAHIREYIYIHAYEISPFLQNKSLRHDGFRGYSLSQVWDYMKTAYVVLGRCFEYGTLWHQVSRLIMITFRNLLNNNLVQKRIYLGSILKIISLTFTSFLLAF